MKIVIDANRIIAAVIKNSTTRLILTDENFEFITPDFTITELEEHKEEIKTKLKISDRELKLLFELIFENIIVLPSEEYAEFEEKTMNDIRDPDDVSYLAACIATNAAGIWTHDPDFLEQKKVKVFTNIDMLKMSRGEA